LNFCNPPIFSMAAATSPLGEPPPPGFMQFQKKVWFHTCAALLKMPIFDSSLAVAWMICSSDWLAIGVSLTRLFEVGHIGLVVLAVMEIERLCRGMRLQGRFSRTTRRAIRKPWLFLSTDTLRVVGLAWSTSGNR